MGILILPVKFTDGNSTYTRNHGFGLVLAPMTVVFVIYVIDFQGPSPKLSCPINIGQRLLGYTALRGTDVHISKCFRTLTICWLPE